MPKISLVVPCYNEESNVEPFFEAIESLFSGQGLLSDDGARYELIFVNDGSTDGTAEKITDIVENKIMGGVHTETYKAFSFRGISAKKPRFSQGFGVRPETAPSSSTRICSTLSR